MKCDEGRPTCNKCRNCGLTCRGYQKQIFFDIDGSSSSEPGTARFRRPLFTEIERLHMSESLTSSVPPKLAYRYLDEIDGECEKSQETPYVCITRGPFGVFRLPQCSPDHSVETIPNSGPQRDLPQGLDLCSYGDDFALQSVKRLSPAAPALIDPTFDQIANIPVEYLDFWPRTPLLTNIFDTDSMDPPLDFSAPLESPDTFQLPTLQRNLQSIHLTLPDPSASIIAASSTIPANAVFLLSHYSTTVINMLTPFRHKKTPWHILSSHMSKIVWPPLLWVNS